MMAKANATELVINIINLEKKIEKKIGGALSIHGLGLSEYLVLHQLHNAPNQTLRRLDLAEQVGLSPSGITRLLNPMEKIGVIDKEENPRDARVSLVALSSAGRRIFKEVSVAFEHAAASIIDPLEGQQSQFLKLIQVLS